MFLLWAETCRQDFLSGGQISIQNHNSVIPKTGLQPSPWACLLVLVKITWLSLGKDPDYSSEQILIKPGSQQYLDTFIITRTLFLICGSLSSSDQIVDDLTQALKPKPVKEQLIDSQLISALLFIRGFTDMILDVVDLPKLCWIFCPGNKSTISELLRIRFSLRLCPDVPDVHSSVNVLFLSGH